MRQPAEKSEISISSRVRLLSFGSKTGATLERRIQLQEWEICLDIGCRCCYLRHSGKKVRKVDLYIVAHSNLDLSELTNLENIESGKPWQGRCEEPQHMRSWQLQVRFERKAVAAKPSPQLSSENLPFSHEEAACPPFLVSVPEKPPIFHDAALEYQVASHIKQQRYSQAQKFRFNFFA